MNALLAKLSPTATRLIRMDHSHVTALFHKLTPDTTASVREATVRDICTALEIHAQLEEEIFYPALRSVGADMAELDKSVPEHDEMRRLIARVRSLDGEPFAQAEAVGALMRAVLHHVADEETVLLPLAEDRLEDRLAELGARMTERRIELAKPNVGQMAVDLARASPAKAVMVMVVAGTLTAGALLLSKMRRGSRRQHSA